MFATNWKDIPVGTWSPCCDALSGLLTLWLTSSLLVDCWIGLFNSSHTLRGSDGFSRMLLSWWVKHIFAIIKRRLFDGFAVALHRVFASRLDLQ